MKTIKTIAVAAALVAAGACLAAEAVPGTAPRAAGTPTTTATADSLPQSLGLVEFLSLVRSHHPALRAMPLRQGMDRADVRTAGTWANPNIHYSHKPDEKEWGIEQPVPVFGQVSMRTQAAQLATATAQAERSVEEQDILNQAAQRFAELLVAQEKLSAKQQAMEHLNQAVKVVQGQVELGARSQYDGARCSSRPSWNSSRPRHSPHRPPWRSCWPSPIGTPEPSAACCRPSRCPLLPTHRSTACGSRLSPGCHSCRRSMPRCCRPNN